MIAALFVAALAVLALAHVLNPLRKGPRRDDVELPQLIEETVAAKRSALLAIIDIDEERALGKLADEDHEVLRRRYEIEALRRIHELDELGAVARAADDALEAEIAELRHGLSEPPKGS